MAPISMSIIDKFPDLIYKTGKGRFSNKHNEFEAPFELIYYPERTIITTKPGQSFNIPDLFDRWKLEGSIDDDFSIYIENLSFSKNDIDSFTFHPHDEIQIKKGFNYRIGYVIIPLVGFYAGNVNLTFQNTIITIQKDEKHSRLQKEKSKLWNIQLEGLKLKIENPNLPVSELLDLANDISLLLSLTSGNNVHFNRQIFYDKNDQILSETWRRKVGYNFGVQSCIEDFDINKYINVALPLFVIWPKEKKDTFLSIVNSINSSSYGYIEERLLSLCIGWESIINSWAKAKKTKNVDLKPLKNHLKKEIRSFNIPSKYDRGFIMDRVLNSLDWEKLHISLENILKEHNLSKDNLELDFKALISIRNDIAHTGQFRQKYPPEFLADLLTKHKQGLQIFLLKELGYNDKIISVTKQWKELVDIKQYFAKVSPSA